MDINAVISKNLTAWMKDTPSLDTIEKVERRSGLGFGTVRRAKNGTGNVTADTLAALASAFGRSPADLITPDGSPGKKSDASGSLEVRYTLADPATRSLIDIALSSPSDPLPAGLSPSLRVLVDMARTAIRNELDEKKKK